jgi:hypothetical protein
VRTAQGHEHRNLFQPKIQAARAIESPKSSKADTILLKAAIGLDPSRVPLAHKVANGDGDEPSYSTTRMQHREACRLQWGRR